MHNSEPVYSFRDSLSRSMPDLSGINEVLHRYMRLETSSTKDSPDDTLLELRHHLLEKLAANPECVSEVEQLLSEVDDLVADSIYTREDRDTILQECLNHWRERLLPHYTELCVETVRLKLKNMLPIDALVDIRFALERGIKNAIPWEDLLLEEVGPAITKSDRSAEQMRHSLRLIQDEYARALKISTL